MLDKDLLRKLSAEQPLTAAETLRLDEALDNDGQAVRELLGGCEDTPPSYAWRSSLNQRLAATRRAPRLRLFVGWAGGLAAVAASALAVVYVQNANKPAPPVTPSPALARTQPASLEEVLVSSHIQGASQSNVGSLPVQVPDDQVFDWSKLDKS